ncbi:MAG: hypothetical protein AAFQ36_00285 [Pseudomonadota bacterium]
MRRPGAIFGMILLALLAACSDPEPPEPGLGMFARGYTVEAYELVFDPSERRGGIGNTSVEFAQFEAAVRRQLDNRLRILPSSGIPVTLEIDLTGYSFATDDGHAKRGADSFLQANVVARLPDGSVLGEKSGLGARIEGQHEHNNSGVRFGVGSGPDGEIPWGFIALMLVAETVIEQRQAQQATTSVERANTLGQDFTNDIFEWLSY